MAQAQFQQETSPRGEFVRQPNRFTGRVTAKSTSAPGEGPDEQGRWPLESGRYRLIWSRACPWAHRAVIVRKLLGLEDAISLGTVDPIRDERGWRFSLDPGGRDPVLGIEFLAEAYLLTDPEYQGRVTVPVLVDTLTRQVVTNDYPQLTLDLSTEWTPLATKDPNLLPSELRPEMDRLMQDIYEDVNNGVYRCGFAVGQEAYDEAYSRLFSRLDQLEQRLSHQRYLFGDHVTEADVRLFTTLVRFDAVYHNHFKCNRNKLSEMPSLWRYARDLYSLPGFGDTVDFDQIKRHYYGTHAQINPGGIVPQGPDLSAWTS
ncbi:glutathione S-transferase C-terminal domain-containing protein [Dactylosporangium darangshiense]|uniref:Glutathione S-transferase C-terminal domain-containing protein n=1 Tax=Dactylosporangium darangshiense TaxID=579108 RepID=A0ABP8D1U0_9ACTN